MYSPELWWVLQSLMGWPGICRCIIFWVVDNWGASMRVGNVGMGWFFYALRWWWCVLFSWVCWTW